ncbi:unnamed protein product [Heligmosomoides polygyrus]|uniref:Reverse transcriptase domain-containing protein n=1 Tax=Heligmosomoides polygyrus TaxID=6339 RepID=A0A183FEA2_HELPZ|nr:unnamed protein product [Heligmosomoides polygyrus]
MVGRDTRTQADLDNHNDQWISARPKQFRYDAIKKLADRWQQGEQFLATFGNVVASTFSLRLLLDGLKLNVKKTEYLTPNVTYSGSIKVKGIELPRTAVFKYLGLTGVLCDKKIPERFKSKIYRAVVRPIAMYGVDCWHVTKEVETSLSVIEPKMLRWTAGVMRMASETMSFGSSVSRI